MINMFKFNVSEEIIFNIRNGDFKNKNFVIDEEILNIFLEKISKNNVLIIFECENFIRERICFEIVQRTFYKNYEKSLDFSVFNICRVDDLDNLYLDDKNQIFYLDDFLGSINVEFNKFKNYIDKISNSLNKMLIVNMRLNLSDKILDLLSFYCEDLNNYEEVSKRLKSPISNLSDIYLRLEYIDKFVLFSVFLGSLSDFDIWFKSTTNYFSANIFSFTDDLQDRILTSFKNLEGFFISVYEFGKFRIKDLFVEDFLKEKFKSEVSVIKDVLNNVNDYQGFKNLVEILKIMEINLNYTNEEYAKRLRDKLFKMFCLNDTCDLIQNLKIILDLYKILNVNDISIIDNLNTKIVYSNFDINNAINYFGVIKSFKQNLIRNDIFLNKLFNLVYKQAFLSEFEFYNYDFKYFLFVSEFCDLYDYHEQEELLDIKKHFVRLINMIFNNINSYFTLEYFCLNNEIKNILVDLKELVEGFNVENIFSEKIDRIFYDVKFKFFELIDDVCNFIPKNEKEYYTLTYFKNEIESNKEFIEHIFNELSVDNIITDIMNNICVFKA